MQPHIGFSFIAILVDAALANPIPEDYPDSDFLSDDLFAPDALDASSPMSFDLIAQPLAFSGLTSLSLDTDWLTDSSASPLEDAQIADFSDRPLETVDSSGAFLESSCEAGSEPFFKRDGEICTPEAAGEPYPSLKLPDLDDLENALGSERKKPRKLRQYLIPPTPGYTPDDDPLCPKPKRRLCCEGPRHGNMIWGWSVIDGCRGIIIPHPFSFSFFLSVRRKKCYK